MSTNREGGFHVTWVFLAIFVVGVIVLVGYYVADKTAKRVPTGADSSGQSANQAGNTDVRWAFNEAKNEWFVRSGQAPACKQPLKFDSAPIAMSEVSAIGMPGTYRGRDYKVHAAVGLANSPDGITDVRMPMDGTLSGLVRYLEGDPLELQYKISFEHDCGISFYFDHLYTLSARLQEIAEKTPAPKANDTRSTPDSVPRVRLRAGEVIATAVGAPKVKRFGFDFGVMDYRQRNEISKNNTWNALHQDFEASEWYGVCWFDMLPGSDPARARALSKTQVNSGRTARFVSDYCSNADFKTIDIEGGRPVGEY